MTGRRNFALGLAWVVLGALGFSLKSILVKMAYAAAPDVDATALLALRMAFSLPIFVVAALWHHRTTRPPTLTRKQWLIVALLGLDGYYAASLLDFAGLQFIAAGLERVILFLYPTFVVLLSALLYRRRIAPRMVAALLLSYAGLVLVFIDRLADESPDFWRGSALVLASALAFAGFTMGSGIMVHRIGAFRFTALTMSVAGAAMLLHFGLLGNGGLAGMPPKIYGLALLITVFSTVLPAFLMNAGIRRIGADLASVISTIGPIATLAFAYGLLDEAVTPTQLAGTALVLAGVYVLGRSKS